MKTITGTFQYPDGTPANGATLYLTLSQNAVALGTSQIAPRVVPVVLDNNGRIPVNTNIFANDELTPSGTVYEVSVIAVGGGLVYGPNLLSIIGTSPINLNNLIPTDVGGIVVLYPNPVLQNPSAPQTIAGQPLTVTGLTTLSNVVQITSNGATNGSGGFLTLGNLDLVVASNGIGGFATILSMFNTTPIIAGFAFTPGQITPSTALGFSLVAPNGVGTNGLPVVVQAGTALNVGGISHNGGSVSLIAGNGVNASGIGGGIVLTPGTGTAGSGFITIGTIIGSYNGINTVSAGVPAEYATVDLTNQSAAIGTTTLYAVPASGAGQYRLSWNSKVTTVDAVSSTLGALTISWTDPDGVAQSVTAAGQKSDGTIASTNAGNTTTTKLLGLPILINAKASTNISYAMAYTSNTPGQMIYNLHLKLEALG